MAFLLVLTDCRRLGFLGLPLPFVAMVCWCGARAPNSVLSCVTWARDCEKGSCVFAPRVR